MKVPSKKSNRSVEQLNRYNARQSEDSYPNIVVTQYDEETEAPKSKKKVTIPSSGPSPLDISYKSTNLEAQQQQRVALPPGASKYFGPAADPQVASDYKQTTYKSQKIEDQQKDRTPLPSGAIKYFGTVKESPQYFNEHEQTSYKSQKLEAQQQNRSKLSPGAEKYFTHQPKSLSPLISFEDLLDGEDVLDVSESDGQLLHFTVQNVSFYEYIWNMVIAILRVFSILR